MANASDAADFAARILGAKKDAGWAEVSAK